MTKSIADRMAEAAEMDLALPYSLVLDAWDRVQGTDETFHQEWTQYLLDALDEYEADQNAYWTPERIARARGTEDVDCEQCKEDGIACTAHEL